VIKAGAKVIKTNLRKRLKEARSALGSTQALLDAANKRLVEHKLDPVAAKAAPTTNGTDGTEDTFSDSNPDGTIVTQPDSFDSSELE
jgi:hypothetical protein